jgi:SulP family sulfate permease
MTIQAASQRGHDKPSFGDLFTPKLVTVIREGYGLANLRADAIAGLTVAIVALPLSMAIAIASHATPVQGLYAAIFGGFLVSMLGGSRFQIGGPAGAFIVLVASIVDQHGMDGLLLATMMAGAMLVAMGFLRLGTYIKFIPYPVTVGFTAGIAVIIFASQIKDLLGLGLPGTEPGPLLEKLPVLWEALPSANASSTGLAALTIITIVGLKRLRPNWPGMLVAVVVSAALVAIFKLPVTTIGSQFGGIPSTLPSPSMPAVSFERLQALLPAAISIALLGSIESLLSAVVADGMTGRRHRSNCELVGQGVANIASAMFTGICVTGTIARTATNVRAGAHGPVSGMLHSIFLLGFILFAAPLASTIPLAALAGVLAVVAWNMVEKHAVAVLLRSSIGDAAVLLTTFGFTIFRDLTEAIIYGFALGSVIFIHRMSQATAIETDTPLVAEDQADRNQARPAYDEAHAQSPDVVTYRISGAFFFGAAASIGTVLDRINAHHKLLIVDLTAVPFIDSTAANTLESLAQKAARTDVRVTLTGTTQELRRQLVALDIKPPLVHYEQSIQTAMEAWRNESATPETHSAAST